MHIVLTNDQERIAGGESFVLFLAQGLLERGHAVTVAPMQGSDLAAETRRRGIGTCEIAYRQDLGLLAAVRALTSALRGRAVDVVHTNSNFDRTIGAIAARRLGCASVTSVHSCLSIQRNLLHWYRNHQLIDHCIPDGHSTKALLVAKDGIPAERITVVHNALPPSQVHHAPLLRTSTREEFAVPDGALLIGTVGRLVDFKGHAHLLDAMALLRAEGRDVFCVIVGDGVLMPVLREQARSLRIEDRIRFAGYRTDLTALYSAFDIFSLPSVDFGGETYPFVVLYALASGLPVVASDVGDVKDMVRDGYNGFLVPPGRADLHAVAMRTLIDDAILRRGMAGHALEKSRTDHSFDAMIGAFETIYEMVLTL
jgi:glycosyltransferase involved in cell wall biosynthesis